MANNDDIARIVGISNKALRLSQLLARRRAKFEQITHNSGGPNAYKYEQTFKGNQDENFNKAHRQEIGRANDDILSQPGSYLFETPNKDKAYRDQIGRHEDIETPEGYSYEKSNQRNRAFLSKDFISIVDIDYRPSEDEPKKFYKSLILPFVPRSIDYVPESNFVGIATLGRNNPNYHFVGSEDIITFDIDWFAQRNDREDVLFNARWIESLTKADGYRSAPHRIKLIWGQDNKMFKNDIWICTSAPYTMSQFVDGYRLNGRIHKVGLLPQQAIQKVTLKRVTLTNRTTEEIIGRNTYTDPTGLRFKRK